MTDIVDRLKSYAEINLFFGSYTEANCAYDAIQEIEKLRKENEEQRLRQCLERVLLDIKFMTETNLLPAYILDDYIYQTALSLMTSEFLKEFNNDSSREG